MIIKLPDVSHSKNIFFTGDHGETLITCEENSYIQLTFIIRVFDFGGLNRYHTVTRKYKCMSFKGNVSIFLGEILDPYFIIPSQLKQIINFSTIDVLKSVPLARPLACDILFEEKSYSSDEKISEQQINNLQFLYGPSHGFTNTSNQLNVGRCTANSLVSYSLLVDEPKTFNLNSEVINVESTLPTSIIYRVLSSEQIILKDSEGQKLSEKWIIPDGLQSIYIFWLDENLSLSFFEFTGKFEIKNIITYVNSSTMSKGVEIAKNLTNYLKKEYVINTGYLFKSDIQTIESILISKKCWISFDQGKNFSSFTPFTKELTYDSQAPLFHFNIEIHVNDDAENHETIEDEYDLIFDYYDNGELADFTAAFDQIPSKVNWGDTTINNEITHIYETPGNYTIKMNISQLTKLSFYSKNITGFTKIPFSVDKINCNSCRLNLAEIKKLFTQINSVNHSESEITLIGDNKSFFSKYIIVSNQQEPVILDDEAIKESQQLILKNWFIEYTYSRDFDFNDKVYSARYITPDAYLSLYPAAHPLLISGSKFYFFTDEEVQIKMYTYKKPDFDWTKYDWDCFIYPRIDIKNNDKWEVKKITNYPVKADAQINFNIDKLNDDVYFVRGVRQSYSQKRDESIHYDIIDTKILEFDVIKRDSIYVRKDSNNEWEHNDFDQDINYPYLNFYPFGFIPHCGLGEKRGYYPTAEFSSASSPSVLKNKAIAIVENGSYRFTFRNFIIDLSDISKFLSSANFAMAYVSPANKVELSNPVYMNSEGKIILDKTFVINDIPSDSYICPFASAVFKSGVTHIKGQWDIIDFSRLIIDKL